METEVKGAEQMLHKQYAADFNDDCSLQKEAFTEISVEDQNLLKLMEKECSKDRKLLLPCKVPNELFPNNKRVAETRLRNLENRFSRDKQYHEDYARLMKYIIQKGYDKKLIN